MSSREVRRVPMDWQHPNQVQWAVLLGLDEVVRPELGDDHLAPMHDVPHVEALGVWEAERALWDAGVHPDQWPGQIAWKFYREERRPYGAYEDWASPPKEVGLCRPIWPAGTVLGIQLWTTLTEGVPEQSIVDGNMCPVFPDDEWGFKELCAWCAMHATTWGYEKASAEGWAHMLSPGGEVSAIYEQGGVTIEMG